MGFRYALHLQDGEDAGTFDTNQSGWDIGHEFRCDGNRCYRIISMIPVERTLEFVDGPVAAAGLWQVEELT